MEITVIWLFVREDVNFAFQKAALSFCRRFLLLLLFTFDNLAVDQAHCTHKCSRSTAVLANTHWQEAFEQIVRMNKLKETTRFHPQRV